MHALGGGRGYFTKYLVGGIQQTVQNVTQQDLITSKNEGAMGYEPVKFGVNGI